MYSLLKSDTKRFTLTVTYKITLMDAFCESSAPFHPLPFLSSPSPSLLLSTTLSPAGEGAPRPRKGHSFLNIKTANNSIYGGHTYLVMFGGILIDRTRNRNAAYLTLLFIASQTSHAMLCLVLKITFKWNNSVYKSPHYSRLPSAIR